jgi:hypothetical protein
MESNILQLPQLPSLPSLCDICLCANSMQIVPDRGEDKSLMDIKYRVFCPLCLDSFCNLFPITLNKIQKRELTGKF